MSIQEVPAEELAKFLHRYHQVLAPYLHCKTASHAEAWGEVSSSDRRQLVTAAKLTLMELEAEDRENSVDEHADRKKYFAEPGTAEWGC
jgi:hypothetical protein